MRWNESNTLCSNTTQLKIVYYYNVIDSRNFSCAFALQRSFSTWTKLIVSWIWKITHLIQQLIMDNTLFESVSCTFNQWFNALLKVLQINEIDDHLKNHIDYISIFYRRSMKVSKTLLLLKLRYPINTHTHTRYIRILYSITYIKRLFLDKWQ